MSGASTRLCDLLSGTAMSGSTRDCDRSTVGLEVVRLVSSELPDGGVRTKRGSTSRTLSCGGS